MRKGVIIFIAGAVFLGSHGVLAASKPVYIWPTAQLSDFINAPYSYQAFSQLATLWRFWGLRGQLFFSGLTLEEFSRLIQEAPIPLDGLEFDPGYHGEESFGPPPVLVEYLAARGADCGFLAQGQGWESLGPLARDRYSHHLDPLSGEVDPTRPGGLALIPLVTGKEVTALVSRHWEAAPAGVAFRSLPGVNPHAIEFGPFPSYFQQNRRPEAVELWQQLTGNELMWYLGVLNFVPDTRHTGVAGLDDLSPTRPHLVLLDLTDTTVYSRSDPWEWAFHNPLWGCFPPSLEAARMPDLFIKSPQETKTLWLNYAIAALETINEFLAGRPECRLVTAKDIIALVADDRGTTLRGDVVRSLAEFLAEPKRWESPAYGEGVRRPPVYLFATDGHFYSLAEVFGLLAEALSGFSQNGKLPSEGRVPAIYGPLDAPWPPKASGLQGRAVTGSSIVRAAADWSRMGLPVVPSQVKLGTVPVNPAEFLSLMAREYLHIAEWGSTLGMEVWDVLPVPYGQVLLENIFTPSNPLPLKTSILQLWTLKPARYRDLSAESPITPRIVTAGYGASRITSTEGGTLTIQAHAVDLDGERLENVLVSDGWNPTGDLLVDDGTNGDGAAGDNIFTWQADIPPGVPSGLYSVNLFALDSVGHSSDLWPLFPISENLSRYYYADPVQPPASVPWELLYRQASAGWGADLNAPFISMAGFQMTSVTAGTGGWLIIEAWVSDPQGAGSVTEVRVLYDGQETGWVLNDQGADGDNFPGDGIFGLAVPLPPGLPPGDYLFDLVPVDIDGYAGWPWPWLGVGPG